MEENMMSFTNCGLEALERLEQINVRAQMETIPSLKIVMEQKNKFEWIAFYLLFGKIPSASEFKAFCICLSELRQFTVSYVRDVVLKHPCKNLLNAVSKGVLSLYEYDENPDEITYKNGLLQSLQVLSKVPVISVYCYYAYVHFQLGESLIIRRPLKQFHTAENIIYLLDGKVEDKKVHKLDQAMAKWAYMEGGNSMPLMHHLVQKGNQVDTYSGVCAVLNTLPAKQWNEEVKMPDKLLQMIVSYCKIPDYLGRRLLLLGSVEMYI